MEIALTKLKELRLKNINNLMKLIGSLDRKFLSSHSDDYNTSKPVKYCEFFFKESKLYLREDYKQREILIRGRLTKSHEFSHGGTLWGLVRDFAEFILTGNYTNGLHGYGGLWCPHWGYEEKSMKEIRAFAVNMNYIHGVHEVDYKLYEKIDIGEKFKLDDVKEVENE